MAWKLLNSSKESTSRSAVVPTVASNSSSWTSICPSWMASNLPNTSYRSSTTRGTPHTHTLWPWHPMSATTSATAASRLAWRTYSRSHCIVVICRLQFIGTFTGCRWKRFLKSSLIWSRNDGERLYGFTKPLKAYLTDLGFVYDNRSHIDIINF